MIKPRTAATLIEFLLVFAFLGVGVAVAQRAGSSYGLLGYVGGFVVGVAGGFAGFLAFGYTIGYAIGVLTGIPEYPECSNGKCQAGDAPDSDYRFEMLGDRLVARCKCDLVFVKKGRRFMRLEDDGSLVPYMIWKPFRGWFPDEAEA